LHPVPIVEELADLSQLPPFHLQQQEPIDDFPALSLHVALLTGTVAELLERVKELEALNDHDDGND
jgi:hypothetical protein